MVIMQLQMASRCSVIVRQAHFLRQRISYLEGDTENWQGQNVKKEHLPNSRVNHTQ